MGLKIASLDEVRERMRVGDIIAFGGRDPVSWLVKAVTGAPVSHAGIILADRREHAGAPAEGRIRLMEAHPFQLRFDVHTAELAERVRDYGGDTWWLPLHDSLRERLDPERLQHWLMSQEGKSFDMVQGVFSAFDRVPWLRRLGPTERNLDSIFCSELVIAGLVQSCAIPPINPSVVTPAEMCAFRIYAEDYWQLSGRRREILGFNSLDLDDWAARQPERLPDD